jgi:PTS system mannose-specific IIB component
MNIVLIRVDDRLIHGQILESWIPFLNAQCVVVANDALAGDQFQRAILSMAIPDRIKIRIVPVEETRGLASDPELSGLSTLIIVSSLLDAYRLHEADVDFARLNIGNMKGSETSRQISFSVWISSEDERMMRGMIEQGVDINLQSVPRERGIDIKSIIDMGNP